MNNTSETELSTYVAGFFEPRVAGEEAWIEVIRKMDEVYADLLRYQVELEEKNTALEQAQLFIASVMSSMTDVLLACDARGRIQQVNRALEELVGCSESALLGRYCADLFIPESSDDVASFVKHVRHGVIQDREVNLRDRHGNATPLSVNCSPRYNHRGRLVGMVLIGRPVGELRRAYDQLNRAHQKLQETQNQLIHSEKMASLGRMVAGVAHELNNPISFIYGNMHALKRYSHKVLRYLRAIETDGYSPELLELRRELKIDRILSDMAPLIDGTLEGAERVSDIVQDLRRYSGGQREQSRPFDLVKVIRTATHWVLKAARAKPRVDYDLPTSLEVNAVKGHVHQIVVNLIQNAVDVMEGCPDARIGLRAGRAEDGGYWLQVRDYGPGIAPENLSRVFDPFFTTKPVGKGTGLGLYISYCLAAEQGGELSASNHPSGGAVFTLRLPPDKEMP